MKLKGPIGAALAGMILAAACHRGPSDTGYTGTWSRGSSTSGSTISIAKSGNEYRFYWKLSSTDGKWLVTCDKDSHCEETFEGRKSSDHRFSTRVDPVSGHVLVEDAQTFYDRQGGVREQRTDVDELIVEGQGLRLASYTIERNGTKLKRGEGPARSFEKLSDAVMEPGP